MNRGQRVAVGLAATGAAATTVSSVMKSHEAQATDGTGKTVLVTGASGGIGKELARVFAAHHFNVIAVARNEQKLEALKSELEGLYGVSVMTIQKDLSSEGAAKEIFDEVDSAGIHVDQLVNNAGAGKQSPVVDADPDTMQRLIHLNVTAPTLLSRYFGGRMVECGGGRIMNVSSMGAFIPDPMFNVYGPTKAYELFLTEAMCGELEGTGVTVTALCPGPTKTNWASNAGKADSKIAKSPREVAETGFVAMQQGKLLVIPDADYRAFRHAMRLVPASLQTRAIARWQQGLIAQG